MIEREPGSGGKRSGRKGFGTIGGVFVPTLLTILGVIMYLREGAVVGNAGLMGAVIIITLRSLSTLRHSASCSASP